MDTPRRVRHEPPPLDTASPSGYCRWLKISPGEKTTLVWAIDALLGMYLHFGGGRSSACLRSTGDCGNCEIQNPLWYGFGIGLVRPSGEPHAVAVPLAAYRYSRSLCELDGRLKGQIFDLYRKGRSSNAPLYIAGRREIYSGNWPALPDLQKVLAHRYGVIVE